MLSLPIYLYPNYIDVILDLDPTTLGVNNVMYQRDLSMQKGVKNKVRIQFKNSDQKLLQISNTGTYIFSMFDAINQRQLLEKPLVIIDDSFSATTNQDQPSTGNTLTFNTDTAGIVVGQHVTGFGIAPNSVIIGYSTGTVTLNNATIFPVTSSTTLTIGTLSKRGIGELILTESDTLDLEPGDYQYSIKYADPVYGGYLPAYSNTYYGIAGTVTLKEDILPRVLASQEVNTFLSRFNSVSHRYEWYSGNLYAYPEFNSNNAALQTVAIYMTNFKGTVTIQGTLSNQPDSAVTYSTILTRTYNGASGIDYANFNGIFTYVRVFYTPAVKIGDSTNDNPSYYGSLDKILYRS